MFQQLCTWSFIQEELHYIHSKVYAKMFIVTLLKIAQNWNKPNCALISRHLNKPRSINVMEYTTPTIERKNCDTQNHLDQSPRKVCEKPILNIYILYGSIYIKNLKKPTKLQTLRTDQWLPGVNNSRGAQMQEC